LVLAITLARLIVLVKLLLRDYATIISFADLHNLIEDVRREWDLADLGDLIEEAWLDLADLGDLTQEAWLDLADRGDLMRMSDGKC
jgi:hypothetical protein